MSHDEHSIPESDRSEDPVKGFTETTDADRSTKQQLRGYRLVSVAAFGFWSFLISQLHFGFSFSFLEETSTRATVLGLDMGRVTLTSAQANLWSKYLDMTIGPEGMGWVSIGHHQWVPSSGLVYPYLMLPFYRLHLQHGLIVVAAALACFALTLAMEAWVGPKGATAAVLLFLSCGSFVAASTHAFLSNSVACSFFTFSVSALVWLAQPREQKVRRDIAAAIIAGVTMVLAAAMQWSLEFAALTLVLGAILAMRRGFVRVIVGVSFIAASLITLISLLAMNRGQHHAVFRSISMDGGSSLSVFWHNLSVQGAQVLIGLPLALIGFCSFVALWLPRKPLDESAARTRFLAILLGSTWLAGFLTVLTETSWSRAPVSFEPLRWVQYPMVMLIGPLAILGGLWLSRWRFSIYRGFLLFFLYFNVLVCAAVL
jgi:hypothetical protein